MDFYDKDFYFLFEDFMLSWFQFILNNFVRLRIKERIKRKEKKGYNITIGINKGFLNRSLTDCKYYYWIILSTRMENTKNGEFIRLVINRRLRGRGSPPFWRSLKLNPKFLFGLFLKWFQKRTTKRYEINVEKNVDKGMETNCYTTYGYVNNTSYMVSFSLRRADQRKTYNIYMIFDE